MAVRPGLPASFSFGGTQMLGTKSRKMRRPQHRFAVRTYPWAIQPIAIAPVLPGDTMEAARIQARVVTDPLKGKLAGWWTELHLFYVKHRDTAQSDNLQAMVLQPTVASGVPTVSGSAGATYAINGRPDFTRLALNAVVDEYFRDEGDTSADYVNTYPNLPNAKLGQSDWTNSSILTSDLDTIDDVNVDLNASGTITAEEVDAALTQWNWLRQNMLTDMTYEDFLGTYGVRTQAVRRNRPELLRSIRDWSYPTNTVTQGTGAVSSACVWSIAERVDKKRFFAEPGWLLLVSVTKPKVYRMYQNGAFVNMLDNAYAWLPAVLRDDPSTSLVSMTTLNGALQPITVTGGITADARDLFLYGDQFLYSAPTVAGGDTIAAGQPLDPARHAALGAINGAQTNSDRLDYPSATGSIERGQLFVGTTHNTQQVQLDGVISFDIQSQVDDMSPGRPAR